MNQYTYSGVLIYLDQEQPEKEDLMSGYLHRIIFFIFILMLRTSRANPKYANVLYIHRRKHLVKSKGGNNNLLALIFAPIVT